MRVAASIVVVGSGLPDAKAMAGAMEGWRGRRAIQRRSAGDRHEGDARAGLWKVLQARNDGAASLIENVEANRALVLYGDVLLVPEALGERRTIVLDAMGAGMAVLAAADAEGRG
ncbi:MAG: hypothetical protein R3B68_02735 [Phycisphaerales bacterium]